MTLLTKADVAAAWGPLRAQGQRPTCLAFVLSDLNQYANSIVDPLSPEYLYLAAANRMPTWPTKGLLYSAASLALAVDGQPSELACPYAALEPAPGTPVPTLSTIRYRHQVNAWLVSVDDVIKFLDAGVAVGLIVKLTPSFYKPLHGVVSYSPMIIPDVAHAVIATAHAVDMDTGEVFVSVRNNWGIGWGVNGFAWLPARYVDQHAVLAFSP